METLDFATCAHGNVVEDAEWKRLQLRPPSASLRIVGAESATISNAGLTYAVTFENLGGASETVYVSRSAAYPADGYLHLDLVGEGVEALQGLRGPEVFAAMGKVLARRLVVPPETAIRLIAQIPFSFIDYAGTPIAEITWTIHVNGYPRTGVAAVSLPLRP